MLSQLNNSNLKIPVRTASAGWAKLKISFIKKGPPFPEDLSLIPVSAGSSVYYDCLHSDLFTVMVTYFDHEITA